MIRRAADVYGYSEMEDRFCGGLSVSLACRRVGLRVAAVEDGNAALINCYRAVAVGWDPPRSLSPEDYAAIKARNDPEDPVTAFALAFCSYAGKWAAGRMPDDERYQAGTTSREAAPKARKDLIAARPLLSEAEIRHGDCLGQCDGRVLYADPPYQGTLGYAGAPAFDFEDAWKRLEYLSSQGPTLVSEGRTIDGWDPVWRFETDEHQLRVAGAVEVLLARGLLSEVLGLHQASQVSMF